MPEVRTYDPKKVVLTIGGIPIGGYADGTFIAFEHDEDAFNKVTGADGITSRSKTNNYAGMMTITLAQTSPSNNVISGFAIADKLTNSGIVPVIAKEVGGTTVVFSANGWVRKQANLEYSKEITDREWVLDLANVDVVIGGNILP